jgi:hypothetical protein
VFGGSPNTIKQKSSVTSDVEKAAKSDAEKAVEVAAVE